MMIDANLLPFSVDELVKSKAWHDATPEQRRKFISAGVTFDSVLTHPLIEALNKQLIF